MMEDKQQLENLYHRAWAAMIAKDKAGLEAVHAPEFVLVHMTGLAAVYGGGKHRWNLQLKFTAKKEGGKWIFTHCAASTYR